MLNLRRLLYFGIFFLSLIASRQAALALFHPQIEINSIATSSGLNFEFENLPITKQVDFLLFHITNIDDPQLLSIWWVGMTPKAPITLLPIYPSGSVEGDQAVTTAFQINQEAQTNDRLSPDILELIALQKIPYDGYIVLDNKALSILIDYVNGIKIEGKEVYGAETINLLQGLKTNSFEALESQKLVWGNLCSKAVFASSAGNFELIKAGLQNHMLISPNFPLTFGDFQAQIILTKVPRCEIELNAAQSLNSLPELESSVIDNRRNDGD